MLKKIHCTFFNPIYCNTKSIPYRNSGLRHQTHKVSVYSDAWNIWLLCPPDDYSRMAPKCQPSNTVTGSRSSIRVMWDMKWNMKSVWHGLSLSMSLTSYGLWKHFVEICYPTVVILWHRCGNNLHQVSTHVKYINGSAPATTVNPINILIHCLLFPSRIIWKLKFWGIFYGEKNSARFFPGQNFSFHFFNPNKYLTVVWLTVIFYYWYLLHSPYARQVFFFVTWLLLHLIVC